MNSRWTCTIKKRINQYNYLMRNLTSTSISYAAYQCIWEKINPIGPSRILVIKKLVLQFYQWPFNVKRRLQLQMDKKMQQPQNNSLPSNQGSELRVQQLRTKLSYVCWTSPFIPTTTHKSEPHLKQTISQTIVVRLLKAEYCCKRNYCNSTLHLSFFPPLVPQKRKKFPPYLVLHLMDFISFHSTSLLKSQIPFYTKE
jgi:hypothetical protein